MNGFVPWLPVGSAPAGQRLAVKDVIDVAGMPTGAGHPKWLTTHELPARDAVAVARLRSAFTVIGKTHTDELAYSLAGTNHHYGTPENPAAPGRVPGGSSSGSAVAVAGGVADLGLGTDTAGSIRVPASYTGLYGLRPTHARAPRTGIVPLAPSFDVAGLLTRDLATLRVAAALLLDGAPEAEPPRRLWFPSDLPVAPAVRAALLPAVEMLAAELALDTTPLFETGGWERVRAAFATVQAAEVWATHSDWIRREQPTFGPGVTARLAVAAEVGAESVAAARATLRAATDRILHGLGDDGLLAMPSAPAAAPPILGPGESPAAQPIIGSRTASSAETLSNVGSSIDTIPATGSVATTLPDGLGTADRAAVVRLTCLAPVCGAPALSVPVAAIDGLPLGLSLLAAPGRDESLLATAELLS
ncbi:amidase family protein [Nocardia sp. NPDC049526]|uniref:amidase family protein n=1 Tax=Nocardia sp. NPDC049526 TaxID=3364316 RepID=UPI00379886EC